MTNFSCLNILSGLVAAKVGSNCTVRTINDILPKYLHVFACLLLSDLALTNEVFPIVSMLQYIGEIYLYSKKVSQTLSAQPFFDISANLHKELNILSMHSYVTST